MLLSRSIQGEDITSHETAVIFFMTEESRVVALCATSGVCQTNAPPFLRVIPIIVGLGGSKPLKLPPGLPV